MNKKLLLIIGAAGVGGVAYAKRETLRQYAMLGKARVIDPLVVRYGQGPLHDFLERLEEDDDLIEEGEGSPFGFEGELDRYQTFAADLENPIDLPPSRYRDRVPMHRWRARARIDEFRQNFFHGGAGRLPTNGEIAQFMGTTGDKVAEILRDTDQSAPDGSLEGPDIPD